ncbi:unnamed protein product (macronuclear) [Paramecium tetraurelia]|uniref:Uncharacterized protein n=1 Tax=Paramecium tetraurelia TaxID=5888 RepID=A0E9K6_PARTE|nr:uncharacterized protein GSPATT00024704001 [Paramecium tetraurelia]CAK91973.1 unnamed protein product [Paramecium tetraurelia]|eukprot:XP_001459370.1 hypothetical protein (macronuclear) [Paramecium tetraurelia strain d4-2]
MGVCKICPCAIPHIEPNSDFQQKQQYQNDDIQQNIKLLKGVNLNITPPCELEIPVNRNKTKPYQLQTQNPINIIQAVSIYQSSQANKVVPNEHQCPNQIDELSKSQLRNQTQPEENLDKQGQTFFNLQYETMLSSNFKEKSDRSLSTEGFTLRNDMIDSSPPPKIQFRVEQKEKTL